MEQGLVVGGRQAVVHEALDDAVGPCGVGGDLGGQGIDLGVEVAVVHGPVDEADGEGAGGIEELVPAAELRSMQETAYLLRSPRNAARLLAALEQSRRGAGTTYTVEALARTLGLSDEGSAAEARPEGDASAVAG